MFQLGHHLAKFLHLSTQLGLIAPSFRDQLGGSFDLLLKLLDPLADVLALSAGVFACGDRANLATNVADIHDEPGECVLGVCAHRGRGSVLLHQGVAVLAH